MPTDVTHRETVDIEHEPDDEAVDAYLRAHGVRPRTRQWEPTPGFPEKPRPMWLAFIIRILRKLGYDDG